MWTWTEENRNWFIRAATTSKYYMLLANALAKYCISSKSIADLGCGLGFLTIELAEKTGGKVTAMDTNPQVLTTLRKMLSSRSQLFVDVRLQDALSLPKDECFDSIILNMFGHAGRDAQYYLGHAEQVLAIVPSKRYKGIVPGPKHKGREYATEVSLEIKQAGFALQREDLSLEFGQPLRDMAEARAFATFYSQGHLIGPALEKFLDKNLELRKDGSLYIPHTRYLSILEFHKNFKFNSSVKNWLTNTLYV